MTKQYEKYEQQAPLLSIKDLHISFKQYVSLFHQENKDAIKGLNFDVHAGEIVAIVGASGSGKSLLAHAVLGILPHNAMTSGNISYQGKELTNDACIKLRGKEIVLIPQSVSFLDPLMTVGKQVETLLSHLEKKAKTRLVTSVFERYKLPESVLNLYPFQLSGGMARRALIAMAVVRNPRLVIADEPTPGLSDELVTETLDNLKQMTEDGCGVVLITHDIQAALSIADKIVIFKDGQTIDCVPPSYFHDGGQKLTHPYTRQICQALPQNQFIDALTCDTDNLVRPNSKDIKNDKNKEINTLSCKDISYGYSENNLILANLNFTIKSNEIIGIKGASGRGKTTLSKVIAGYHKQYSGTIHIDDKSVENGIYNPIQLIYQHPEKAVNPRWKLGKTLTEAFPKNQHVLNILGIDKAWLNRYPHELSGGELQRFSIARALHPQTRFLIADEMTAMLDTVTQAIVWNLVIKIAKENNMGLLIISHDDSLLKRLCNRIIEL